MKEYSLKSISKNRDTIYGFSILLIAFAHSTITLQGKWLLPIQVIKGIGNIGADIFLMMSGIMQFFSFRADSNVCHFYRKRLRRVLLPSLLVGIPFFLYKDIVSGKGIGSFFLDLFGISLFTNGTRACWFVTAILILYFLYPAVYSFFQRMKWSVFALLELLSAALLLNLFIRYAFPPLWTNSEILFRRIPAFLIGAYSGKYVYEEYNTAVNKLHIVIIAALFFLCFEVDYFVFDNSSLAFERYAYVPLSFAFICLFSVIGDWKAVRASVGRLAPYTLEIYLTHEKCIALFTGIMRNASSYVINITAFLVSVIAAIILKQAEKYIIKAMNNSNK